MAQGRKGSLSPITAAIMSNLDTLPTTGGKQLSFYAETFNASDNLQADPAIEHDNPTPRDPKEPGPGLVRAGGSLTPPLDFAQLTFWLRGLLGAPDVTGSEAPYSHVYSSGLDDLAWIAASWPVSDDHWKLAKFLLNTMTINLGKEEGYKRVEFGCLASNAELVGTEPAFSSSSPSPIVPSKAAGSLAKFGIDGAMVGNITAGSFSYSNNASLVDLVDGTPAAGDFDTDDATIRTDITARLVKGAGNNALLDRFTGKIADAFPAFIEFNAGANAIFRIDMPRCVAERRVPQVNGRQTLSVSNGFMAYPSADGSEPAATFTLTNAVAGA